MSDKIFISYSRKDKAFVQQLVEDLSAAGADTWLDSRDIPAGERWDTAVHAALQDCGHFLIVLTPASVKSDNVLDEVAYAIGKKKRVFPVLAADCDIPYRLVRVQYVDFLSGYDAGLQDLLKELGRAGLVKEDLTPPRPEPENAPAAKTQDRPAPLAGRKAAPSDPLDHVSDALKPLEKGGKLRPRYLPFLTLLLADTSPPEAHRQGIVLRGHVYRNGRPAPDTFTVNDAWLAISDVPIDDPRHLDVLLDKVTALGKEELFVVTPSLSAGAALELGGRRIRTSAVAVGPTGPHTLKVLSDLAIATGAQAILGSLRGALTRTAAAGLLVVESSPRATLSEITFSDLGHCSEIRSNGGQVAFKAAAPDVPTFQARREELQRETETAPYHADQVFAMDRLARLAGTAGQDISDVNFFNRHVKLAVDKASVDALPLFSPPRFEFKAGASGGKSITIGRGYASPYFISDAASRFAVQDDCYVLLFAGRLTLDRVLPLLEKRVALRRDGLVIIANSAGPSLEATLTVNKLRGILDSLLITLDPTGRDTKKMLERTAGMLNTPLFDESSDPAAITIDRLGPAAQVVAREYETVITLS